MKETIVSIYQYPIEGRVLRPLSELIESFDIPIFDSFDIRNDAGIFDRIFFTESQIEFLEDSSISVEAVLVIPEEIELKLPGCDSFSLVIASSGNQGFSVFKIRMIVGNEPSFIIKNLSFTIRIPPSILKRVNDGGPGEISFYADFIIDSDFDIKLENMTGAYLSKCFLLNTKISASADNIRLKLSKNEADEDVDNNFQGLIFEQIQIGLPPEYVSLDSTSPPLDIIISKGKIGTTGFTGEVEIPANPNVSGTILGYKFRNPSIDLKFVQNSIIKADFSVEVQIGALENKWFDFDFNFTNDGFISATLAAVQTENPSQDPNYIASIEIERVVRFDLTGVILERSPDNVFTIFFSGDWTFLFDGAEDWPSIGIDEIGFSSDGKLVFHDGAGISLQSPLVVQWNAVQLTIEKARLGASQSDPNRMQLVLDPKISFGFGLPAGGSVKGLTIEWGPAPNRNVTMSCDGIGIHFSTSSYNFAGEVSYVKLPDGSVEFRGNAKLDLISLDISVEVSAVFGYDRNRGCPYFYLFASAEGMKYPIGSTGLILYGFMGLSAMNMTLGLDHSLPVDEKYYELFTRPPQTGITHNSKWIRSCGEHAMGFGVIMGTADGGWSVNIKGLLAITFPTFSLLMQSKVNLLKKKAKSVENEQEGALECLLSYSSLDRALTFDILAKYMITNIVNVNIQSRAFFDFNDSSAWYFEIGKENKSQMAKANLLKFGGKWLFDGGFWLLLNKRSIQSRDLLEIDFYKKKAGFWIKATGTASGYMMLSYDPKQYEGRVVASGEIGAGFKGVGITVGLSAGADALVATPFYFYVELTVKFRIKLVFTTLKLKKSASFKWENDIPPVIDSVFSEWYALKLHYAGLPETNQNDSSQSAKPTPLSISLDGTPSGSKIPPDALLILNFKNPMNDDELFNGEGGHFLERQLVDFFQIGAKSNYLVKYNLKEVKLTNKDSGEIVPLFGSWERTLDKPNMSLKLNSLKQFETQDGSITHRYLNDHVLDYCQETPQNQICHVFDSADSGQTGNIFYRVISATGNYFFMNHAIHLSQGDKLQIKFNQLVNQVTLKTRGQGIVNVFRTGIRMYSRGINKCTQITKDDESEHHSHRRRSFLCHSHSGSRRFRNNKLQRLYELYLRVRFCLLFAILSFIITYVIFSGYDVRIYFSIFVGVVVFLFCMWCGCRCSYCDQPADGDVIIPSDGSQNPTTPNPNDPNLNDNGPTPDPFDEIVVETGEDEDGLVIEGVCYLPTTPFQTLETWAEMVTQGGWAHMEMPFWKYSELMLLRPNTNFELSVKYTHELKKGDSLKDQGDHTKTTSFATGGPPNTPDSLIPYVSKTFPIDGQRPVFTGYDLQVKFGADYVSEMYGLNSIGEKLVLRLFDKDGKPILDDSGQPVNLEHDMTKEPMEHLSVTDVHTQNLYQRAIDSGCLEPFDYHENTETLTTPVKGPNGGGLTPNSKYTVWLVSNKSPQTPLFKWSFTTSRFARFTDLFNTVNESQVWVQNISNANSILNKDFDGIVRDLGLPSVNYVEKMELTALVENNMIKALLLESPEPIPWNERISSFTMDGNSLDFETNLDDTRAIVFRKSSNTLIEFAKTIHTLQIVFEQNPGRDIHPITIQGVSQAETINTQVDFSGVTP